jgi:transposase
MSAGIDALLALVRKLVIPNATAPKILGVDDWAMRRGHTYGTVLVDLERGCIIDLLPDRTPESLAHWLRDHPGIEVISRDRADAYAEGIRQGAPDAIQVADRWHLLHNLAEALHKVFQQHHTVVEHSLTSPAPIETAVTNGPTEVQSEPDPLLRDTPQLPSAADQRRQKRVEAVQQLHGQGWSQLAIAAHLRLSNKTVRRYLNTSLPLVPQRRTRRGLLEPYKAYLIERWNGGCHNAAQLWREIVLQGFGGRMTTVRNFALQLRQSSGMPPRTRSAAGRPLCGDPTKRPPTLRGLTWLVLRQPETLEDDEIEYLARVRAASPEVQTAVELAHQFSQMVRQRQVEKLDRWLEAAIDSGINRLGQLATSLRRDGAAVRAALTLPWSNGPTEGHINRIKCVKRQMYGRAKLDLLGKRLVAT